MDHSLQIEKVFGSEETLSKEQLAFQKRVKMVSSLKKEIAELKISLEEAFQEFNQLVMPLKKKRLSLLKTRIQLLGEVYLEGRLSKKLKLNTLEVIRQECKLYLLQEEDFEVQEIFEKCSSQTFQNFLEEEEELNKDIDNFWDFSISENQTEPRFNHDKTKSKAQQKKEAKEAAKEEAKKRSVKEIYRDLIKVYHPDKELDGEKKVEKEEISKKITEAYKKDDLLALLQYELELLQPGEAKIKELATSKLKIYNEILNEQRLKLESELYALKSGNEFVYRGMCTKLSNRKKFLREVGRELKDTNESMEYQIDMLRNDDSFFKEFINHYLDELYFMDMEDM